MITYEHVCPRRKEACNGNGRKFATNQAKQKGKEKLAPKANIKKELADLFYKNKGHLKKDCTKYKRWLEKKGNPTSFVCYESIITNVNHNT